MSKKHLLFVVLFVFLVGLFGCEQSVKIDKTFFNDSKTVYKLISDSMNNHGGFMASNDPFTDVLLGQR